MKNINHIKVANLITGFAILLSLLVLPMDTVVKNTPLLQTIPILIMLSNIPYALYFFVNRRYQDLKRLLNYISFIASMLSVLLLVITTKFNPSFLDMPLQAIGSYLFLFISHFTVILLFLWQFVVVIGFTLKQGEKTLRFMFPAFYLWLEDDVGHMKG
jgi:hypothetical protein